MRAGALFLLLTAISVPIAARDLDVRLVEPSRGQELVAGSTAVLSWEAASLPAAAEEWEAFASIDGGRTYPLRITPHLDRSIRRFLWTVPDLSGADVTILLRFGDERDESAVVFAQRARITGVASPVRFLFRPPPIESSVAGESAQDDGDGVIDWIDGARDGSGLHEVSVAITTLDQPGCRASRGEEPPDAVVSASTSDACAVANTCVRVAWFEQRERAASARSDAKSADILRMSRRLNI